MNLNVHLMNNSDKMSSKNSATQNFHITNLNLRSDDYCNIISLPGPQPLALVLPFPKELL